MANIRNIDAETGANFIGDDAEPTLRFTNTSTGPGLSTDTFMVTSGATIVGNTSTAIPVTLAKTVLSAPSIPLMQAVVSTASTPVLGLTAQAFVSAVSIVFAASANWAGLGAIAVTRSDGTLAWIPVLPPAVVTAAVKS